MGDGYPPNQHILQGGVGGWQPILAVAFRPVEIGNLPYLADCKSATSNHNSAEPWLKSAALFGKSVVFFGHFFGRIFQKSAFSAAADGGKA